MWLERISGGGAGLIELDDAKNYLRIMVDDFDDDLEAAIGAASAVLDVDEDGYGGLGFPLLHQQWIKKSSSFNADSLRLPFARIASVQGVHFISPEGVTGVVPPESYRIAKEGRDWRIELVSGACWPNVAARADAVELNFTAGWANVGAVPGDIKAAARLLVRYFFESGAELDDQDLPDEVQRGVTRLTSRYRRFAI